MSWMDDIDEPYAVQSAEHWIALARARRAAYAGTQAPEDKSRTQAPKLPCHAAVNAGVYCDEQ